jgi:excisionase family DNA binding protein
MSFDGSAANGEREPKRSRDLLDGTQRAVKASATIDALMEMLAVAVAERLRPALERTPVIQPRLMNVSQAAQYLGCSTHSVRHQIKAGRLPYVRRERRVFLDVRDIDRMIESCKNSTR